MTLEHLRPKIESFRRPHSFSQLKPEYMLAKKSPGYIPRAFDESCYQWVEEVGTVELLLFDAAPGIEGRAYDLGLEIQAVKKNIKKAKHEKKEKEKNSIKSAMASERQPDLPD